MYVPRSGGRTNFPSPLRQHFDMGGVNTRRKINLYHKKMTTKKRGPSYSPLELASLLETIKSLLPIGQEDWETVCSQHLLSWPDSGRDYLSIRRKFNQLANKNMPTGNPSCPPEVRDAKAILDLIKQKADIEIFDGEDVEVEEGVGEVATDSAATINDTGGTQSNEPGTTTTVEVSPNLKRVSNPRKRKNEEEMTINDLIKYQIMEREADRKEARERERVRAEEEREYRRRNEAQDRMFQNMFMAVFMQMKGNNGDGETFHFPNSHDQEEV